MTAFGHPADQETPVARGRSFSVMFAVGHSDAPLSLDTGAIRVRLKGVGCQDREQKLHLLPGFPGPEPYVTKASCDQVDAVTIPPMALIDTDRHVRELQDTRLREMSELERAEIATGLTLSVQKLAFVGMRERFPQASDDEIWIHLAVSRLGPDMVRRAYGRLPGEP